MTDKENDPSSLGDLISIHTFLAEGDSAVASASTLPLAFQSTPSSRKVTDTQSNIGAEVIISIHTFLAEGDLNCSISTSLK